MGIVFAATAIPNVFLGPLPAPSWADGMRRATMVACDLVRAGLVLLVPLLVNIHIALVYLVALAVAMRWPPLPAGQDRHRTADRGRGASSPPAGLEHQRDARRPDRLSRRQPSWPGWQGHRRSLCPRLATTCQRVLIWGMVVYRARFARRAVQRGRHPARDGRGWRFLTHQSQLLANTVVSTVAQLAFGAEIVCSLIYAKDVLDQSFLLPENYGWLMARLDSQRRRWRGDWLVRLAAPQGADDDRGLIACLAMVGVGLTNNVQVAIALFFAIGVANMLYLVPTITSSGADSPAALRAGRFFPQALTGAMAISIGAAGYLAGVVGAATVLMLGGGLIAVAGLGTGCWSPPRGADPCYPSPARRTGGLRDGRHDRPAAWHA